MVGYRCVCKERVCNFKKIKHCTKQKRDASIVIPTYDEKENISRLIKSILKALSKTKFSFEIVIADDNSPDGTGEIADNFARKTKTVVVLHRYGKGNIFEAIKDGIKLSRGKVIVIMDADFSHPPEEIPELLKYISDYDIVSGSRFVEGGKIIATHQRSKYYTLLLNKVCRVVMGLKEKDLTGGFHAIKKEKFNELHFKYPAIWGEFDLELLYEANKKGFKIKEVPFTYIFRKAGKSKATNLLKYAWVYLIRSLQIRFLR